MLFYFPAEIRLPDLPAALAHWTQLLSGSPLDVISQLQISFLGWQGDQRYELRGKGGFASYVIFDRCVDHHDEPLREWVPRLSGKLFETDDEDLARRPAAWFSNAPRR